MNCSVYFGWFNENVIFVRLTKKRDIFSSQLFFKQKKKKRESSIKEDQLTKSVMNCLLAVRLKENFNFKSFFFCMSILCSMKIIKLN